MKTKEEILAGRYSAEGPACQWTGPCESCGRPFHCEMTEASCNDDCVHLHMARAKSKTFHSAIGASLL